MRLPTDDEKVVAAEVIAAIQSGPFFGEILPHDPSAAVQLYGIFHTLDAQGRSTFRSAVTRIIYEWLPSDDVGSLLEVLRLVGFVRATDAIRPLRRLVEEQALILHTDGTQQDEVLARALAVLQGFAPHPDVEECVRSLLYGDVVTPRFGTKLFLALCECRPDEFSRHVPRYLELMRRSRDKYAALDISMETLLDLVTLDRVLRSFNDLSVADAGYLLSLLSTGVNPSIVMTPIDDGIMVRRTSTGDVTVLAQDPRLADVVWQSASEIGPVKLVQDSLQRAQLS